MCKQKSVLILNFAAELEVQVRYRDAYTPEGNGIVERCHRTVKRIAARMRCSIQETVYWYNVTPRDDVTTLTVQANGIYWYKQQIKEIDQVPDILKNKEEPYKIGNLIWVKPPNRR